LKELLNRRSLRCYDKNIMNNTTNKIRYYLYARKSSESEDKQMQSVEDQIKLLSILASRLDIEIVEIFEESKSAKAPGTRPVYAEMIKKIEAGKADGILTWHLNRLTRNPVDSGYLSWILQKSIIKKIQTIDKYYLPEDNVILFNVETGAANQFIIELRKNSLRGTQSKADKGWMPAKAPLGYLNYGYTQGEKTIIIDEQRFYLMRKMWDMVLAGEQISKVRRIANKEWGLTTLKTKRSGGKEIAKSSIYRMFSNIFYTGKFEYRGKLYQGKHQPMITMEEFEKVQKMLQRRDSPRPYKQDFAYTGIAKCGCGCENSITAERKFKELKCTGELREYVFYRSTRRKKIKKCVEEPVTEDDLNNQIINELGKVEIRKEFLDWANEIIDQNAEKEINEEEKVSQMKKASISQKEKELENLKEMRMKDFIDDESFLKSRNKLKNEIETITNTENHKQGVLKKKEALKTSLMVISKAKECIQGKDDQVKKKIIGYFGYNHTLLSKEFLLTTEDWLTPVLTEYKNIESEYDRLEPSKTLMGQRKNEHLELACPRWGDYRELNPNCRYHKPE
jgi:site-specific DNA recombinase